MVMKDFYRYLKVIPNDWEYRSIFADWLFDHNYSELEKAQRWMIKKKRHPLNYNKIWIWGILKFTSSTYKRCSLQKDVFDTIVSNKKKYKNRSSGLFFHFFSTTRQAEEALGKALCLISQKSKKKY